jgi:hypothetical protein
MKLNKKGVWINIMKGSKIFEGIVIVIVIFLSACTSSNTQPINTQPINTDPNAELYEELNTYMVKANVKCSALLDAKLFGHNIISYESGFLTNSGKVYDINLQGLLYSTTNENCGERAITKGKNVEYVINGGAYYYIDGNFYETEYYFGEKLVIASNNSYSKNDVKKYGIKLFEYGVGNFYVYKNKVYGSGDLFLREKLVIGLEAGEIIERVVSYSEGFYLLTNKSIFTYKLTVNEIECQKYADVQCTDGFIKDEIQNTILNDLKGIMIYYDGNIFIDIKGDMYYMKSED